MYFLFLACWVAANSSKGWAGASSALPVLREVEAKEFFAWAPVIYFVFTAWAVAAYAARLSARAVVMHSKEVSAGAALGLAVDVQNLPETLVSLTTARIAGLIFRAVAVLLPCALLILLSIQTGERLSSRIGEDAAIAAREFISDRNCARVGLSLLGTVALAALWICDLRQIQRLLKEGDSLN